MNVSGLDGPPSVTITTGSVVAGPVWGGMANVQVVWSGQLTEAVWPFTVALMLPDGLRKPEPLTTTDWPAIPDDGCRLARTGAPTGPGAWSGAGTVVVVPMVDGGVVGTTAGTVVAVVAVVVEVAGTVEEGCVTVADDRCTRDVVGGAPPPASIDPTRAATIIRTAADITATARRSRRSVSRVRCAVRRFLTGGDAAVA